LQHGITADALKKPNDTVYGIIYYPDHERVYILFIADSKSSGGEKKRPIFQLAGYSA